MEKINGKLVHQKILNLRKKEKEILYEMLIQLKLIYESRYFLNLGYTSLFQYLVKELGYSEGSAQRRVVALKISESYPELKKVVEQGQMNLSNFCLVGKAFENSQLNGEEKKELINSAKDKSFRELEKIIMQRNEERGDGVKRSKLRSSLRRVSSTSFQLTVEITEAVKQKLEKIKGLKQNKNLEVNELVEVAVEFYLQHHSHQFAQKEIKKQQHSSLTPALKANVWKKAQGKCQAPGCMSHYHLEVEHLHPQGKGGNHCQSNLSLFCRAHNQMSAIKTYGDDYIKKYLRKRQSLSESIRQ